MSYEIRSLASVTIVTWLWLDFVKWEESRWSAGDNRFVIAVQCSLRLYRGILVFDDWWRVPSLKPARTWCRYWPPTNNNKNPPITLGLFDNVTMNCVLVDVVVNNQWANVISHVYMKIRSNFNRRRENTNQWSVTILKGNYTLSVESERHFVLSTKQAADVNSKFEAFFSRVESVYFQALLSRVI